MCLIIMFILRSLRVYVFIVCKGRVLILLIMKLYFLLFCFVYVLFIDLYNYIFKNWFYNGI